MKAGRQATSVTDKEAVNASLRGFLHQHSTQVASLQAAFKTDLPLLRLHLLGLLLDNFAGWPSTGG